MYQVTLLLVVGVASLAAGDVSLLHSPLHHGSPSLHASPIVHSPLHHESPILHHDVSGLHSKPSHHGRTGYGHETYHNVPAAYNYNYLIHDDYSGAHFGQDEIRDGYKTEGKYFVHLPDGRIQTVTYYADDTGYHATVSYEGEAHYDAHVPKHAPAYHAPEPAYHAPEPAYHAPEPAYHF